MENIPQDIDIARELDIFSKAHLAMNNSNNNSELTSFGTTATSNMSSMASNDHHHHRQNTLISASPPPVITSDSFTHISSQLTLNESIQSHPLAFVQQQQHQVHNHKGRFHQQYHHHYDSYQPYTIYHQGISETKYAKSAGADNPGYISQASSHIISQPPTYAPNNSTERLELDYFMSIMDVADQRLQQLGHDTSGQFLGTPRSSRAPTIALSSSLSSQSSSTSSVRIANPIRSSTDVMDPSALPSSSAPSVIMTNENTVALPFPLSSSESEPSVDIPTAINNATNVSTISSRSAPLTVTTQRFQTRKQTKSLMPSPSTSPLSSSNKSQKGKAVMTEQQLTCLKGDELHRENDYDEEDDSNDDDDDDDSDNDQHDENQRGNSGHISRPKHPSTKERHKDPEVFAKDKRRRNTEASARFRVKKKLREQVLHRTAEEMTEHAQQLQRRVNELEKEVSWLRELIVEKKQLSSTSDSPSTSLSSLSLSSSPPVILLPPAMPTVSSSSSLGVATPPSTSSIANTSNEVDILCSRYTPL